MTQKPKAFRLTAAHKRRFLELVSKGKTLEAAATEVGATRRTFYSLRDPTHPRYDEKFAAAFHDAWAEGAGQMIEEARRRAVDGWDEPVFHQGEVVGTIAKHSDGLLMFLIKQRDPSFRENHRLELTGPDGGAVQVDGEVRHVVGLGEVFELLTAVGALERGDGTGAARPALPAAPEPVAEPRDG